MPQRRRAGGRAGRREKDSCCFEFFLFMFFFYYMFDQWERRCNWFFNSYCFSSCTLMIIIRRYQTATLDEIEDNPKY